MQIGRSLLLPALALVPGCAPPAQPMPVDLAEAQCVRTVLGGSNRTAVTIGVGTGTGGWGWDDGWGVGWGGGGWGGTGVAVSTTLPDGRDPIASYNACVLRKSGQMPDTPLSERPEVKG